MPYAYVNSGGNSANSATISYSATAGNLLVLVAQTSAGGGTPTITSITDNISSSGWVAGRPTYESVAGIWMSVWYLPNCGTGITSVTVTFNNGKPGTVNMAIAEYSGIRTISPFLGYINNYQAAPGTGTDAVTSTNLNVTDQPSLLFGWAQVTNAGTSSTAAGTNFTHRYRTNSVSLLEDRRITATGNVAATATAASGTHNFATIALAFLEARPTITTQPTSVQTTLTGPLANNPAVFTAAATASTGNITAITVKKDGVTITDGGAYDIVTTGVGSSADATVTLSVTSSDLSLDGSSFTFDFTDSSATTTTSAAVLTVKAGTTIAQPAATDGSGQATAVLTTDVVDSTNGQLKLITFTRGSTVLRTTARKTS